MRIAESCVVYECERCGARVIVDSRYGEQPPEDCESPNCVLAKPPHLMRSVEPPHDYAGD